jgi:UDP-N-acetylglucosamine 4,6-dehydratase/5-epimerase
MTRYLMSTREAISLIFAAVENSLGGELFVMNMPAATVETIANVMISLFGNKDSKIEIIGKRPGEKTHEVLVSKNECPFTYVFSKEYYVILPQINNASLVERFKKYPQLQMEEFNSQNTYRLSDKELEALLKKESWLWQ